MSERTPRSLIEKLKDRNPEGWERLLMHYRDLIRHWAKLRGVPVQDAEDLRASLMLRVLEKIGTFEPNGRPGAFREWLRLIVGHLCQEKRRSDGPVRAAGGTANLAELQDLASDDPAELIDTSAASAWRLVRGTFSEQHVRVFELKWLERKSPAEIAAETGLSAANVRQILSRVIRALREELGDAGPPAPRGS